MNNRLTAALNVDSSTYIKLGAWVICITAIVALGLLRMITDAEFTFASAAIVPVVIISWIGGQRQGTLFSLLAAVMWTSADLLAERHFSAFWIPYANGVTQFATYGFVSYLISNVKALLVREKELATRDELTKLLNRRAFFELGEAEVDRSRRYGHSIAIVFFDLDDFKTLNDTRGHRVGDQALQAVAQALRNELRSTDHVARLGGDEFAILLPELGFGAVKEAGDKISSAVNRAMKQFSPVSVSVGISWFEAAESEFSSMLASADSLMYEVKREGKHGVRIARNSKQTN